MLKNQKSLLTSSKLVVASFLVAFAVTTAGAVTLLQSATAEAQTATQTCDDWNIVRCGLTGSTLSAYIASFKSLYTSGTDNGNNDLKTVYRWAGATDANVDSMSTSNTKLGTLYKNGEIKVDGKVVGTNAWVTGRYSSQREGFQHVTTDVYARATTNPYYTHDTAEVIVHYAANGEADYAVMTGCGNSVKFTPVPVPKPVVSCDLLTQTKATAPRTYEYKVQATAKNTTIVSYDFHFGDNKTTTVTTGATTATTTHTFPEDGKTYSSYVDVNTTDMKGVSSDKCRVVITTPGVTCDLLTATQDVNQKLTYKFAARATAKNTKIVSYVFHFGDSSTKTVTTDQNTAEAVHTYAENNKTYIAYVEVNTTDIKNLTANTCKVTFTTPKVDECKPGVPVGSDQCQEVPPVVTPPTELPNTGPGALIGIFGATSAFGTMLHRFILRRRFQS